MVRFDNNSSVGCFSPKRGAWLVLDAIGYHGGIEALAGTYADGEPARICC